MKSLPRCSRLRFLRLICISITLLVCGAVNFARAATGGPVLLTEPTSTRAIAVDSVTFKRDPFPLISPVPWSADRRTRVMLFAMNLEFLAGEGVNALTADAEDGSARRYSLVVEYVGKVPGNEWLSSVVVRLGDNMDNIGDVLVRLNLHGVASNRVRVAIGRSGGGPPDDAGAVPMPAPSTPPPPTPTLAPNPYTDPSLVAGGDGVRFLEQVTWGPTTADLARLRSIGIKSYLDEQFAAPMSSYPTLPLMNGDSNLGCPTTLSSSERSICLRDNYSMYPLQLRFFQNALGLPINGQPNGQDQLRQRVAFALHQILVVSGRDINQPSWMAPYLQILDRNAFGNYRQILYEITLNPGMGRYLDMVGNTKANPNENYAREVLQLFSIGLDQLNTDGTPKLDSQGNRIPTYDQATVTNFARVFTGWNFDLAPAPGVPNYINPMVVTRESNHDTGQKVLLNGAVLPANQTSAQDLNAALDNIFNHPNVGPFISKQLIQHLVTSNPSPAYVQRVATVFNNNRTNPNQLQAVVTVILLDPEARGDLKTDPNYGHLREPAQYITNVLRAFSGPNSINDGYLNPRAVELEQDVFRAPTVFNYYQPDYVLPGTNGVLGPEFAILSTSTALKRANFANLMSFSSISASPPNGISGTSIDRAPWVALAGDPQQLVNALDALLMHGTMSPSMRNTITQTVAALPSTDAGKDLRAKTAIYLILSSSQYQVER